MTPTSWRYHGYATAVFRFACKCVGWCDVAEDITSEVFLSLYRNRASVDVDRLPGWLFAVAKNRAIDYWRRAEVEERRTLRRSHRARSLKRAMDCRPSATYRLSGVVTNAAGEPLEGVTVGEYLPRVKQGLQIRVPDAVLGNERRRRPLQRLGYADVPPSVGMYPARVQAGIFQCARWSRALAGYAC